MVERKKRLQCQEVYLNKHRRGHALLGSNIDFFGPSIENVTTCISPNVTTGVTVNCKNISSRF